MKNMKWIERIVYVSQLLMIPALLIRLVYMYITYGNVERTVIEVICINVVVLVLYNPITLNFYRAMQEKERKQKDEIQHEKE